MVETVVSLECWRQLEPELVRVHTIVGAKKQCSCLVLQKGDISRCFRAEVIQKQATDVNMVQAQVVRLIMN